jgi:hypothetical protein
VAATEILKKSSNKYRAAASKIYPFLFSSFRYVALMKLLSLALFLILPLSAQTKRGERKSLLDNDPRVVYLTDMPDKQIELMIIKEAPVFSDVDGKNKLGTIQANQKVKIEAITDKAYKVRGKGTRDGIAGWVGPWAFASKDPQFVENLKKFYTRQLEVNKIIAENDVAMGMTTDEVALSLGQPTRSTVRQTAEGKSGAWEFIQYEEQKNYTTVRDPVTGNIYRQLVSVTQVAKSKRVVEFTNGVVSAVEDSEGRRPAVVVLPIVFGW